jgi:hypothetical protein
MPSFSVTRQNEIGDATRRGIDDNIAVNCARSPISLVADAETQEGERRIA